MKTELSEIYKVLCQQLGDTQYQIDQLTEKSEQIRERIENLNWVTQQLPKPVTPEVVDHGIPMRPQATKKEDPNV